MPLREIRPWTLCGLIGAFIDLGLAYFLLCTSAFVFFPSKFLRIIGLNLPCLCNGFFGYKNGNLCWHRLLIAWPVRKIHAVQLLAKKRFPFDLLWFRDENCKNWVIELGSGGCDGSFSGSRNRSLAGKGSGSEARGKRALNVKQRSGIRRRRRRANLAYEKLASVLPYCNLPSGAPIFPSRSDYGGKKASYSESLISLAKGEDGPQDDRTTIGNYKDDGTFHSIESSGPFGESNDIDKNSVCLGKYIDDAGEKKFVVGSEFDAIRLLEQALEEEKAASAALYLELEKERAAAATAADEAMAMISRLQKDKASVETEAMQYQRMIEEKFAYDEEEIEILKEILVRREREKYFLEKEIEIYRHMNNTGDKHSNGKTSDTLDEPGQRPFSSSYSSADPETALHKTVDDKSHDDDTESNAGSLSSHEVPYVEKQSYSMQ